MGSAYHGHEFPTGKSLVTMAEHLRILITQTLRVLIPDTQSTIDEYIKAKGLGNAVLAVVQLEDTGSRPDRQTLVDLAVVREELPRVECCLCCITSPLNNLSMVVISDESITDDSANVEMLKWLWVGAKYLKAQAEYSGIASSHVLEWYAIRINEINAAMMQIRRKETLILEQAPSAS